MRILFLHNRYLHRGGEDESRRLEMDMLRAHGQTVLDYEVDNAAIVRHRLIQIGARSVWNKESYRQIRELIQQTRPDVVKVDNFFPLLSPSILSAAKDMGVSTVLSVRNYRLICPAATLFRDGHFCGECVGKRVAYPAILHRCYHNSSLASISVIGTNAYAHWNGTWQHTVDRYIAVSAFVRSELIRGGFPAQKISVKPNFIPDTGEGTARRRFALYVGRLTPEKGVLTLLEAWCRHHPEVPLTIIGDGPLRNVVQRHAANNPRVNYLGQLPLEQVLSLIGQALCLIFPSQWAEPFGRSIVEAYSKATPVVAAETTPIRELIDGTTGLLFTPGSASDLVQKLNALTGNPDLCHRIGQAARQRYLRDYTETANYRIFMTILTDAMLVGTGKKPLVPSAVVPS